MHLVLAHMCIGGLVDVLEQIEMGPPAPEHDDGGKPHILKCYARPRRIAQYEVSVTPTIDLSCLRVPVLLIAWILPVAGAGLVLLGMSLQVLQSLTLQIRME